MQGIEAVRIGVQYSRAGAALIGAWTLATLAILSITPWSIGACVLLMAGVVAISLEALARVALLRGPRAVRRLWVQRDGTIEVERPSGACVTGQIRAGSFVAPWLVIVRWRARGCRWDSTVLLLGDMADAQDLRRLRVLLRWG